MLAPRAAGERSRPLALVTGVAPVAIALLSLLLSVYTIVDANRTPSISLTLPTVVRVAQGTQDAWLYLQPRFIGIGQNERVAVISDIRLRVEPEEGEPLSFVWDEQGVWQYVPAEFDLTWVYVADPAPLVVSPTSPQYPINLFIGPPGWEWQPGTYRLVLKADQSTSGEVLQGAVRITLEQAHIDRIRAAPGDDIAHVPTSPD